MASTSVGDEAGTPLANGTRTRGRPAASAGVVAAIGAWPRDAAVVRRALEESACRGVPTTLLYVDDETQPDAPGQEAHRTVPGRSPLRQAECQARGLGSGAGLQVVTETGPVVTTIIRASRAADLVVVGSEEDPAGRRLVRGAVTANVAARSHGPVEVVPVPGSGDGRHQARARVLVIISEVDQLEELAGIAIATAVCRGARLVVWETCPDRSAVPDSRDAAGREDLSRRLQTALVPLLRYHPDLLCEVATKPGLTASTMLNILRPHDLVVTARGRGPRFWGRPHGLTRALVERACCPVIVVPCRPSWELRHARLAAGPGAGRRG